MASERYSVEIRDISDADVALAIKHAAAGKFVGRVVEWRMRTSRELVLRMRGRQVGWFLRFRTRTIKLDVSQDCPVIMLASAAIASKEAIKQGSDLKLFAQRFVETINAYQHDDSEHAFETVLIETAVILDEIEGQSATWTWGQTVDAFLKKKEKNLKEPWRSEYAKIMRMPCFKKIWDVRLVDLNIKRLDGVRIELSETNAISTVHRAVQQSKAMLDWAWRFHPSQSGLTCDAAWWSRWAVEYKCGKSKRRPTIAEIARTLALAERHRSRSEKEHTTGDGALGALWAVALTGQRAQQVVGMRRDRLFVYEDPDEAYIDATRPFARAFDSGLPPDWRVYNWAQSEMKAPGAHALAHSLPLPPEALEILLQFRGKGEERSRFLFPSAKAAGSVTKSGLNILIYRLEGRRYPQIRPSRANNPRGPSQPQNQRENLLATHGIQHWSPHDVRRTLTTFLTSRRLGAAASAILAHRDDRTDDKANDDHMLSVTEVHYNLSQRIALKAEGMQLWVSTLLAAYRAEKVALGGTATPIDSTGEGTNEVH